MATYFSTFTAGETDTNVFDTGLLTSLMRSATQGAFLSEGGTAMTYDFDLLTSFSFTASGGLSAPWSGTITGISTVVNDTQVSGGSGFAVDATTVRDAIADGDGDALNALFWSGNDQITGNDSKDTLRGFAGSDLLIGGMGNDTLIGDAGADRLAGGKGLDNLFGGSGNDRLYGERGNDVLVGGAGNDLIVGGLGSDTMSGGTGADTFRFRSLNDIAGNDVDRITDFSHAQHDQIDLTLIDANSTIDGDQAFTFIDSTSTPYLDKPPAGSLIVESGKGEGEGNYIVSLSVSGFGDQISFLVHTTDGVLTADDFVL